MSVTNTLVYYAISTILMKKSFITLATIVEDETKKGVFVEPKSFSDFQIFRLQPPRLSGKLLPRTNSQV
jgi:hypothetical protein